MKINEIELHKTETSLEELQLLNTLLSRMTSYTGTNIKNKMTENERVNLINMFCTINGITRELEEEGYTKKDIIE